MPERCAAQRNSTERAERRTNARLHGGGVVLCSVQSESPPLPRVLILGPRGAGCSTFLRGFTDSAACEPRSADTQAAPERTMEWGSAQRAARLIDGGDSLAALDQSIAAIVFIVDASNAPSIERDAKPLLDAALARVPPHTALLVLANKQDVAGALSVPEIHRRLSLDSIVAAGRVSACHVEGSSLAHAADASAEEAASHAEDFAARGVDWLMAQLHGEDPALLGSGGTDHALRGGDNTSDEEDDEEAPPAAGQSDDLYGGRLPHLPCLATAVRDYLGSEDGELSFRCCSGQKLVIYEDKGGVLRGSLVDGGRLGAFPKNVVEVSEFDLARARATALNGGSVLPPKPQILCMMLGLIGSGKSTLLARLRKPGQRVNRMAIAPTLAFTPTSFEMGRVQFGVYDLGRGEQLQAKAVREQRAQQQASAGGATADASQQHQLPWNFTSDQAQALIFVVDSADPLRLDEAREELMCILCDSRLAHAPLLVLASKADLPGALSVEEIARRLKMDQLPPQRKWRVEQCSVKLVGDAQTPAEQPAAAASGVASDATAAANNVSEHKDTESKVDDGDDASARLPAAHDGTEGIVRGFRWISEQLHPADAAAGAPSADGTAAAVPAVSSVSSLAALQSHLPSFVPFAAPIAAVATNYVDAATPLDVSLYPGQSVEVLGIVKERARFVVRTAEADAAGNAALSSSASSTAASAAAASPAAPASASAAAASSLGLVPFNTLRSFSLNREHDLQMAHVARGTRVEPGARRYVAVGDWEGRGAAPAATDAAAGSAAAAAAAASSPSSPTSASSLPASGELSFPRGSTLLVNRDLGHWLRGHLQGDVAGETVGEEGLIPSAWVRTAAFVEAHAAEQEAKNSRRQGNNASQPARGGRT